MSRPIVSNSPLKNVHTAVSSNNHNNNKMVPSSTTDRSTMISTATTSTEELTSPFSSTSHSIPNNRSSLHTLYAISFLSVASSSLVSFTQAPALMKLLGHNRATITLSSLSAGVASVELIFAPYMGALLDRTGRKPALSIAVLSVTMANLAVALYFGFSSSSDSSNNTILLSVGLLSIAKVVSSLSFAYFSLASQAVIADVAAMTNAKGNTSSSISSSSSSSTTGSMIGKQMTLISAGFFVGALGARALSKYESVVTVYGLAGTLGLLAWGVLYTCMTETMQYSSSVTDNTTTEPASSFMAPPPLFQSPLSCARLLTRHSSTIRVLGILYMLQVTPSLMGDTFQILARTEFQLSTQNYASLVASFGILGILGHGLGSVILNHVSIRSFVLMSSFSGMCTAMLTTMFGVRGLIYGLVLGCLSSGSQSGVMAALIQEGTKQNIPQGQMAGERLSLMALMKIVVPLWYSIIYTQGKRLLNMGYMPFVFNFVLAVSALCISYVYL